jgi:hypothetical protein
MLTTAREDHHASADSSPRYRCDGLGNPMPGVYSKIFSIDPDTGARTAMQRLVPAEGYTTPTVPHYHHSAKEILLLWGKLSFGRKTYLGANGYCFHPPKTVLGFKSDMPKGTTFLLRHSKTMCTHAVPEPAKHKYYALNGTMPDRSWTVLPDATANDWQGDVITLGEDSWGEGSRLMRFDGANTDLAVLDDLYEELFVLNGSLSSAEGVILRKGA